MLEPEIMKMLPVRRDTLTRPVRSACNLSDQIVRAGQLIGLPSPSNHVDAIVLDGLRSARAWALMRLTVAEFFVNRFQGFKKVCSIRSRPTERHRRTPNVATRGNSRASLKQVAHLVIDLRSVGFLYDCVIRNLREIQAEEIDNANARKGSFEAKGVAFRIDQDIRRRRSPFCAQFLPAQPQTYPPRHLDPQYYRLDRSRLMPPRNQCSKANTTVCGWDLQFRQSANFAL